MSKDDLLEEAYQALSWLATVSATEEEYKKVARGALAKLQRYRTVKVCWSEEDNDWVALDPEGMV